MGDDDVIKSTENFIESPLHSYKLLPTSHMKSGIQLSTHVTLFLDTASSYVDYARVGKVVGLNETGFTNFW